MRPQILLAAAAAALAFPIAASAATGDAGLDSFSNVCAETGGTYVNVLKAADSSGWTETQVVPETDSAVSITDQAAREKVVNGATMTLLVNRGLRHTKGGDISQSVCKISVNKPDAGVIDRAKTWLGFAPDGGDATLSVYYVKGGAGAPQHLAQSELNNALSAGGFAIIKVQQDSGSAIFVYQGFSK
jgi:hypothetical protein